MQSEQVGEFLQNSRCWMQSDTEVLLSAFVIILRTTFVM